MKKIIVSMAIVASAICANAQVGYGVKLGLNVSNLTGDDSKGVKSKIGVHAGGFVNIPVAESFAIQPELLFSTEGAKVDGGGSINLNYVNVPLMLQYKSSGFYGELGPQIGLLVSANAKEDGDSDDIKEFLKSSSFALNFGAGYQLESGFGFGARYSLGLSNIAKDDDVKTATSVLSIGIHYNFGAKSKK
jgi:hypothetical protein